MTVEELERRFYELKGKLDVGTISEEQFKSEVVKLRFQDKENRWWMIGAQSGKWYMFDGARWIPSQPPVEAAPPSLPPPEPAPTPAPQPRPMIQPSPAAAPGVGAPAGAETEIPLAQRTTPLKAQPALPRLERRARRAAPALSLPAGGPLVIGCAALAAVVLVLVFWFAVENFVPGKPISSLFKTLAGGSRPSGTLTPTRASSLASSNNHDIALLIAAGDSFLLQSQVETALTQYQSAAQIAPSSSLPLTRWSRALALRGQFQDALAKAQLATQRAPNDAEALAQLCRVLTWSGQVNDAIRAGEKAVQIDSKNSNAHAFLAEAYLAANRSAEAQTQAQAALQAAPQSAEAHRAQAWVLTMSGQTDAALAEWRQTTALEPDLFFRHFELAQAYRLFKSPADAVSEYQKSIQLYGAYIPAYTQLGLALLDLNQPRDAIPQFQHAITLDPGNAAGYAELGVAFGRAGQCSQAIPYFEQALTIDANSALAQGGLNDCKGGKAPAAPPPAPPSVPLAPPTLAPSNVPRSSAAPAPTPAAGASPGGQLIFSVYDANANALALFRASPLDGSGRTLLAVDASSASIRSDGALLIFTDWDASRRGIWSMGIDGSNRQRLTERNEHILASISPSGGAFVFASRAGPGNLSTRPMRILMGALEQTNKDSDLRVLTDGQSPTWGPTNRIAYKPCARGGCGLALINPDGSGMTTLADFADITVPAWSPDGSKIVVGARTTGEAWNLYLIDLAARSSLQLSNQAATDGPAAFSPDGKSIAFLSSRNSTWAIWLMNVDGSNLHMAFDLGGPPAGSIHREPAAQPGQAWWEQRIVWTK